MTGSPMFLLALQEKQNKQLKKNVNDMKFNDFKLTANIIFRQFSIQYKI